MSWLCHTMQLLFFMCCKLVLKERLQRARDQVIESLIIPLAQLSSCDCCRNVACAVGRVTHSTFSWRIYFSQCKYLITAGLVDKTSTCDIIELTREPNRFVQLQIHLQFAEIKTVEMYTGRSKQPFVTFVLHETNHACKHPDV